MDATESAKELKQSGITWVCGNGVNTHIDTLIRVPETAQRYFQTAGLGVAAPAKPTKSAA